MHKPIIFNKGLMNDLKDIRLPFPAEIHNNVIDPKIGKSGGKRILNLVCECPPFRLPNKAIIDRADQFDLILTHDEELLNKCHNASKMLFGTSWIMPEDREGTWDNKSFGVSFVCGAKNRTKGHQLRHKIWIKQEEITIPKVFWASSIKPVKSYGHNLPQKSSDKWMAFSEHFHIAIENIYTRNYFSEKLIDCFVTKTIPIYWGCPNIGDYFNINGILIVANDDDVIHTCNILTENDYKRFKPAIKENYKRALLYARPLGVRLQEKIIKELK